MSKSTAVPPLTPVEVAAYLKRLDLPQPEQADLATLTRLQAAHLAHIPFENLSIVWGQPITLNEAALFAKIIGRQESRGGFCYELNGLFSALLAALGYDVIRIQAQVVNDGRLTPPFAHMALLVTLPDGRYLVEVGFGDTARLPIPFPDGSVTDVSGRYQLRTVDGVDQLQKWEETKWVAQYHFSPRPHALDEYAPMCHYFQSSPDSPFTQRTIVSRATSDGRISLTADQLTITEGDVKKRTAVPPDAWPTTLYEYFNITPNEPLSS